MSIQIDISLSGIDELIVGVDLFERKMRSFRTPLLKSAKTVADSMGAGMLAGGSPNAFAPLSLSTLARTPNRIGGPLLNTGKLFEAVTDTTGEATWSGFSISDDSTTVGVSGEFAGANALQFGYAENNLPAREYVRATDDDVDTIYSHFWEYTDLAIEEAFKQHA